MGWASNDMRALVALVVFGVAGFAYAQEYHLPFSGRWFVMQGGDTLNVNEHMRATAQWYGADFAKVGGPNLRAVVKTTGSSVTDFYSWGEPVLSPVGGEVTAIVDGLPDNALGGKDESNPAGNHVVIRAASNRYVFIAHLKRGSITVKPGQRVLPGQAIGNCGNSGNSDFPHIHMHVQDTATFNNGIGQNIEFVGISVELSGKQFDNVTWPLIRGMFVANE
jgi:murein DD-endopeptidase MepM/ murein hydrolase activator NlpD